MMKKKLNQLAATAICGNDISSSCLYVSALAIVYAVQYAWISLLSVSFILFLFRKIYGEVVSALPLNGGAYNALLNTTKKFTAYFAASLTGLSYVATAVISTSEAIKYLSSSWLVIPIIFIFIFHLTSLVILCLFCIYFIFNNGLEVLITNFKTPTNGSITNALFFGFALATPSIKGFKSSANYVEEQEKFF
jgi:amino acid transporter